MLEWAWYDEQQVYGRYWAVGWLDACVSLKERNIECSWLAVVAEASGFVVTYKAVLLVHSVTL